MSMSHCLRAFGITIGGDVAVIHIRPDRNALFRLISGLLLMVPWCAWAQGNAPNVPNAGLPAGEIQFSFTAYSNNVKVLPPLVGEWQLGVSNFAGAGTIKDGKVSGTVTDVDNLRGGTRAQSSKITGATYKKIGDAQQLILTVEVTGSSHPSEECAVGLTGTLTIQDSPYRLKNGKEDDFVGIGSWSGNCNTHIHGWNNEDPGPRTDPPTGGRGGGLWADVSIEVKAPKNATGAQERAGYAMQEFPEPMYLVEIGPKPGTAAPISYALCANPDGFQVGEGYVKKTLGGPFHSAEEVRAASPRFNILSIGPVLARVYDSKGKWLSGFTVLLDPSSGGGTPATASTSPSPPSKPPAKVQETELRGLAMETRLVHSGTQLTMPVLLKGIPAEAADGLGNMNFEVAYDPAVVSVAGKVSRGNVFPGGMLFEANAAEAGRIRIGFAGAHGVTQTGTVAQIPFQVRGQPGQQTALTLKVLQCQTPKGHAVTLAITHGKISIASPTPPPESLAQSSSHPPTGSSAGPGSSNGPGNSPPEHGGSPANPAVPPGSRNPDGTIKGAMGGRGEIKAVDSEGALQMSVGNRPVDTNLDADSDGQVMSADARLILQGAANTMRGK